MLLVFRHHLEYNCFFRAVSAIQRNHVMSQLLNLHFKCKGDLAIMLVLCKLSNRKVEACSIEDKELLSLLKTVDKSDYNISKCVFPNIFLYFNVIISIFYTLFNFRNMFVIPFSTQLNIILAIFYYSYEMYTVNLL